MLLGSLSEVTREKAVPKTITYAKSKLVESSTWQEKLLAIQALSAISNNWFNSKDTMEMLKPVISILDTPDSARVRLEAIDFMSWQLSSYLPC